MSKAESAKLPKSRPTAKDRAKQSTTAKRAKGKLALAISKQTKIVELLSQPTGTTVTAIMKATGWQQHSVHGFLSGVVRKKLGLTLVSNKTDGARVYRIAGAKPAKPKPKVESKGDQTA